MDIGSQIRVLDWQTEEILYDQNGVDLDDDDEDEAFVYMCQICGHIDSTEFGLLSHHCSRVKDENDEKDVVFEMKPKYELIAEIQPLTETPPPEENGESKVDSPAKSKKPGIKDEEFFCDICGQVWKSINALRSHICGDLINDEEDRLLYGVDVAVSVEEDAPDDLTDAVITDAADLLPPAPSSKSTVCDVCKKKFKTKGPMLAHRKSHFREKKKYQCGTCQKYFRQMCHLKDHMRRHTGEKPFVCGQCSVRFAQKSALRTHMRTHTDEKPFPCKHCGLGFKQRGHLTEHMRTQHQDGVQKAFPCPDCGKQLSCNSALATHMKIHTDERPYQCNHCHKRFRQKTHLTEHMHTHKRPNERRSFTCGECDKNFSSLLSLKSHISIHSGDKPYMCKICGKGFRLQHYLSNHLKNHHENGETECEDVKPTQRRAKRGRPRRTPMVELGGGVFEAEVEQDCVVEESVVEEEVYSENVVYSEDSDSEGTYEEMEIDGEYVVEWHTD